MDYFELLHRPDDDRKQIRRLFGGPRRRPDETFEQRHMDLAASVQAVTEEVVLRLARAIARETQEKNLCLAGGVALNCVANGKLLRDKSFDRLFVQPAAGDAGGALGAAFAAYHLQEGGPRFVAFGRDTMKGSYLGPALWSSGDRRAAQECRSKILVVDDNALIEETVEALSSGQAVGWRQGRLEFGPRALGGASILADPRSATMQRTLNLKVKFRESFRPFAPSVLRERVSDWFELDEDSPYMLLVADVTEKRRRPMTEEEKSLFGIDKLNVPRSEVPAVTHVDYSARVQTVHADTNPRYHRLLSRFEAKTGCPVLVNTSFNVRGEPIVATPEDAFRCFMGTELDFLAIGNCILRKHEQDQTLLQSYEGQFELD